MKTTNVLAGAIALPAIIIGCTNRSTSPNTLESTGQKQPNIIFIFSDDHANQAISAYNTHLANIAPTPNIDRIAKNGALFTQCKVTNSICAPSRATVLTGKYSHLNSVKDNKDRFDSSQVTLPKVMQQAGYNTAIVGKWHLKSEPTGFDYWEVLPGQGSYYNPDFKTTSGTHRDSGYVTDLITQKALAWLKQNSKKDKPFMLMLQQKAPHREWLPALEYAGFFSDTTIPEPATLHDDYSNRGIAAKEQEMEIYTHMLPTKDLKLRLTDDQEIGDGRLTETQQKKWNAVYDPITSEYKAFKATNPTKEQITKWKYQRYMDDYLACIKSVDIGLGQVLDFLEANGLAENTIVIYSSDQGFYLGEHGWFDKRFMYKQSYQTPLLMQWPAKIEPGQTINELVSNVDFAPTLIEAAGAEIPAEMQGKSIWSTLGPNGKPIREVHYYHYYEPTTHHVAPHEGVFDGRFKLINFYTHNEWEFYDLKIDSLETNNLINAPEYADEIANLKQALNKQKKILLVN